MDWWQIVLIILASIIVGLLVGYLLSYLIVTRLFKKPFGRKREATAVVEDPLKSTAPDIFMGLIKKRETTERQAKEQVKREAEETKKARETEKRERKEAEQQAKEQAKRGAGETRKTRETEKQERKEAVVVEEPLKSVVPELITEIENNHRTATEPWAGKLLPFQTSVWDTNPGELHILPENLREDLTQAYTDMRLANSIVWLSAELGRRSHNLDENYMKLCTNIAERLNKIKLLIERLGE